jgi:hypothetical protein
VAVSIGELLGGHLSLWISMPVNRTLILAKVRTVFNSSWISSTCDLTYTGVNQVPWAGLPLISAGDEEKVHGVTPATPRQEFRVQHGPAAVLAGAQHGEDLWSALE